MLLWTAPSPAASQGAAYHRVNQAQQSVAGTNYAARTNAGRTGGSSASLLHLRRAIMAFYADTGRLPAASTSTGFEWLVTPPPGVKNWRGPYISLPSGKPAFTDPWGMLYLFTPTSRPGQKLTFEIRSAGPDGIYRTADELVING